MVANTTTMMNPVTDFDIANYRHDASQALNEAYGGVRDQDSLFMESDTREYSVEALNRYYDKEESYRNGLREMIDRQDQQYAYERSVYEKNHADLCQTMNMTNYRDPDYLSKEIWDKKIPPVEPFKWEPSPDLIDQLKWESSLYLDDDPVVKKPYKSETDQSLEHSRIPYSNTVECDEPCLNMNITPDVPVSHVDYGAWDHLHAHVEPIDISWEDNNNHCARYITKLPFSSRFYVASLDGVIFEPNQDPKMKWGK